MIKLVNYIFSFWRIIFIYESKKVKKKIFFKKFELAYFKSYKSIKSKSILKYFKISKFFNSKKNRFKLNQYFLVLLYNKKPVSYCWTNDGDKHRMTELNIDYPLKDRMILFDGETPLKERNKGFYIKMLTLARQKFKNKTLIAYSLITNKLSKRGIVSSGYNLKYKIHRFFY